MTDSKIKEDKLVKGNEANKKIRRAKKLFAAGKKYSDKINTIDDIFNINKFHERATKQDYNPIVAYLEDAYTSLLEIEDEYKKIDRRIKLSKDEYERFGIPIMGACKKLVDSIYQKISCDDSTLPLMGKLYEIYEHTRYIIAKDNDTLAKSEEVVNSRLALLFNIHKYSQVRSREVGTEIMFKEFEKYGVSWMELIRATLLIYGPESVGAFFMNRWFGPTTKCDV